MEVSPLVSLTFAPVAVPKIHPHGRAERVVGRMSASMARFVDLWAKRRNPKHVIARRQLEAIRFEALNCRTKRGVVAYLRSHLENERMIDCLGELVIDLQQDLNVAVTLRDGQSIRSMLRSRLTECSR